MDDYTLEDILGSDVKIVDHTTRKDGLLIFPLPDGPVTARIEGKLDVAALSAWCNSVRGEYIARKNRKEAEARAVARAAEQAQDGGADALGRPGAGDGGNQASREEDEASLDSFIESKVAALAAKAERYRQVRDEAMRVLDEAESRLARARVELERAQRTLAFLTDASEDSGADSS